MTVDPHDNPYWPSVCNGREKTNSSEKSEHGITKSITFVWAMGLLAIPIAGFVEKFVTEHSNEDFRLGWIFLVGPTIACLAPMFAKTTIPIKIIYVLVTVIAIAILMFCFLIASVLLFGLPEKLD